MKILNLYAGIGGNRKLWSNDHNITAVEYNQEIADIYKDNFPNDTVIVADAHQYLLDHYKEFDFIWSSPPCPTHSEIRRCGVYKGDFLAVYPDMGLYQEIILLQAFAPKQQKWVIENVNPYYEPLIPITKKMHRHFYWANFPMNEIKVTDERTHLAIKANSTIYGFNLDKYKIKNKVKVLRNMVDPELGLHILNTAQGIITRQNVNQTELF